VRQKPNRSLVVFPLLADGSIGAPVAEITNEGRGSDPTRQERPHAQCVLAAPDNRYLVVSDLGLDQLVVYRFDGSFVEHVRVALPPGSGPDILPLTPICLASTWPQIEFVGGDNCL
jgi:6-phosphogluconolactonase